MARFRLGANAEIDVLTQGELDQSLQKQSDQTFQRLAGIKPLRFQLQGTPSGNALTLGDPSTGSAGGIIEGPNQGYVWSVRLLVIEGLTSSATAPDQMNVYRNARIVWQLNGNSFGQTWGRGEMLLYPGEAMYFKNNGNLAATGQITAHGIVENVPAELVGKFY